MTLLAVVPLYLAALLGKRPLHATIHYGCLGYLVYSYAYYLLGASLNAQFPLYAAILVLAIEALGILLLLGHRVRG